jgi:hypothetical protein
LGDIGEERETGLLEGLDLDGCICANVSMQEIHLQTITEVLQSIKASEMTPMLQRIFQSEGGSDILDTLMKYLYATLCPHLPQLSLRYESHYFLQI